MSGFKNTTRTVSGHHHWGGGSIGGGGTGGTINRLARGGPVDKIDANPGHPEVYPKEGNRLEGNSAQLRKEAPTAELAEHGGKSPLTAGYKKGGPPKHFHVHKHFHAKGGHHTVSRSYSVAEKAAEKYATGGGVHDCTEVPAQGPDYAEGGKVHKNAGGALYAPGGLVAPQMTPPMGGAVATSPMNRGAPPPGALQALQKRPVGLPVRQPPPMRRPIAMPGPQPLGRAKGGEVPMRKVAKAEVKKHVRAPKPRGHGVR
jgi:hypothetical protein